MSWFELNSIELNGIRIGMHHSQLNIQDWLNQQLNARYTYKTERVVLCFVGKKFPRAK